MPDPRAGGVCRPHARPRERRPAGRRDRLHQAQGRRARRGRRRATSSSSTTRRRPLHLETVLHTEIYALRPDVGAVVHGHPPYVTAFGATNARARAPHSRRRPLRRRRLVFDETAELITEEEQGRAVADALGPRRAVILAQPRRRRRRQGRPLGRAQRDHPRAGDATTGDRHDAGRAPPHPTGRSPSGCVADKYQDRFLDEYWAAWVRHVAARRSRRGHAAGMRLELRVNGRSVVRRNRAAGAAARRPARPSRADRREALLRHAGLRRVHRARRRTTGVRPAASSPPTPRAETC